MQQQDAPERRDLFNLIQFIYITTSEFSSEDFTICTHTTSLTFDL